MGINYTGGVLLPSGGFTAKAVIQPTWVTGNDLGSISGGTTYSLQLQATPGYPYEVLQYFVVGHLPTGLSLNSSTGILSGTIANNPATYHFAVKANVVNNTSIGQLQNFIMTITNQAPIWTTAAGALTSGHPGTAYSYALQATDPNSDTVTYSVTSGSLPTGLTLTNGTITGTPTTVQNSSFTITASDGKGATNDRAFTLAVSNLAPTWTTAAGALTGAVATHSYSQALIATDLDNDELTFTVSSGFIPTGLTLNSTTGVLSGTPTVIQNYSFSVSVSDPAGETATRAFTLDVVSPNTSPVWQSPSADTVIATITEGDPISYSVLATDPDAGQTVSYSIIGLPSLSINSSGLISGTVPANSPETAPSWNTAAGSIGTLNEGDVINFPLSITPYTGRSIVNVCAAPASGGTTAFLPWGFHVENVNGTPTILGTAQELTDGSPMVDVTPKPVWTSGSGAEPISIGSYNEGAAVSFQCAATVDSGKTVHYQMVAGTLPWGVWLDAPTGNIQGSCVETGVFSETEFLIAPAPTWTTSAGSLGAFDTGIAITNIALSSDAVSYNIVSGFLPWGLQLSPSGIISGTPVSPIGTFNFTVRATGANGGYADRAFSIVSQYGPPVWTTSAGNLATQNTNSPVNVVVVATAAQGGTITYSIPSGSALPTGLSINSSTGAITGTPSVYDNTTPFSFAIRASDGSRYTDRTFSITLTNVPSWTTGAAITWATNATINTTLVATMADASSVTYSVVGSLPSWLTLTGAVLSGTAPSSAGTYNFTIRATGAGVNTDRTFTATISAFSATGGTITNVNGYTIHTFTSSGTFTILGNTTAEVLVVAGGGGGSTTTYCGGGGAGGLLHTTSYSLTTGTINVTIGNGGSPGGGNGGNSVFGSLTAIGGGYGGGPSQAGGAGGSGGGGGHAGAVGGAGTAGQGYAGGTGYNASSASGGAGGGASGVGANGVVNSGGSHGGDGLQFDISGTPTYYAGGGAGGVENGGYPSGTGGLGGGGRGRGASGAATSGTPNTGGGGGGGGSGAGGSGIVIVRYQT
jgi:hypothetical protein